MVNQKRKRESNMKEEQFDAMVDLSLVELVQFGSTPNPEESLAKHLLAVSVAADPGSVDTSESFYRVVGTSEGKVIFKVYNLKVRTPEPVTLPTNILDNTKSKKSLLSRLFGK